MKLKTLYLTENECYKVGQKMTVKGIMVHSTGANNPNLKRYVGPDDGLLGVNQYGNHWNTYRPGGRQVCVHAFIGKLKDGSIATYQTLPWDMRGWHAGGNANNTHIGFEICEDGLTDSGYLKKVYKEAVELCAYLCKRYKLDPLKDGVIICHSEGYKRGVASNHGDVMHWWPKHGLNMDGFRKDVAAELGSAGSQTTQQPSTTPATPSTGLKVGDVVDFTGTKHYTNAAAKTAKTCKPGKAKVTAVASGKAHPYHLIAVSGGGSTVYGWVDAADIKTTGSETTATPYLVKVTATVNIRKGPGTNYGTNGQIKDKGVYTIVAESSGTGATKWGKLKSGAGWISLDYTRKL